MLIQGIAGAEGPPGKDGLVGERVREHGLCLVCCFILRGELNVPFY